MNLDHFFPRDVCVHALARLRSVCEFGSLLSERGTCTPALCEFGSLLCHHRLIIRVYLLSSYSKYKEKRIISRWLERREIPHFGKEA